MRANTPAMTPCFLLSCRARPAILLKAWLSCCCLPVNVTKSFSIVFLQNTNRTTASDLIFDFSDHHESTNIVCWRTNLWFGFFYGRKCNNGLAKNCKRRKNDFSNNTSTFIGSISIILSLEKLWLLSSFGVGKNTSSVPFKRYVPSKRILLTESNSVFRLHLFC